MSYDPLTTNFRNGWLDIIEVAQNRRHRSWIIAPMFALSLVLHPAAMLLFEMTRTTPLPTLQVSVGGSGTGIVFSAPSGIRCGTDCSMSLATDSLVKLTATVGENSTFEGWTGPCGSQSYELFGWIDNILHADDRESPLHFYLLEAQVRGLEERPLSCEVTLSESVQISARFGVPPKQVEVAMLDTPAEELDEVQVQLPKRELRKEELLDIEELQKKPVVAPPKEEVVAQSTTKPPPPPETVPNMKAVEVPDQNEVKEAPDDARYLSDKNRDVAEETRATETNLQKQSDGEAVASQQSDIQSEDIGGEDEEIAQLEDLQATALKAEKENTEALGSESGKVVPTRSGDDGQEGDNGESGDNRPSETPGLLAMRNITGRGTLGRSGQPSNEAMESMPGAGGARGRRGRKGQRGPKLRLTQTDYANIVGKEVANREVAVAKQQKSRRRGRWERKLGMMKSSLENFTPEVRPGNQTALKTRASPFALYITRMHRGIHELWGFGYLEGLASKPSSHPLNNWDLMVKLEIVINPDGTVDKMTILKHSGILAFDVSALDVINSAAPYEPTPKAIRSHDGKVYMHWAFHRDWRQCGTFNAEPYILNK